MSKLPTKLRVETALRRCSAQGIGAYVIKTGNIHDGVLLLNINNLDNKSKVITEHSDPFTGQRQWGPYTADRLFSPQEANDIIKRALERDPDLWVIEIEDRNMVNPFEEA